MTWAKETSIARALGVSPGWRLGNQSRAGREVCGREAFALLSEGHLMFLWQGKCPPEIGHLVIVGDKTNRGG